MPSTELQSPALTADEWELLGELLRREARNLPIEMRHTDARSAREAIHRRLDQVEALLEKLKPVLEV